MPHTSAAQVHWVWSLDGCSLSSQPLSQSPTLASPVTLSFAVTVAHPWISDGLSVHVLWLGVQCVCLGSVYMCCSSRFGSAPSAQGGVESCQLKTWHRASVLFASPMILCSWHRRPRRPRQANTAKQEQRDENLSDLGEFPCQFMNWL